VKRYATIVVEDLKIKNRMRSAKGTLEQPGINVAQKSGLNRSIADAGWAFLSVFSSARAGGRVIRVKPEEHQQFLLKVRPAHANDNWE
jgi:putative transposase